MWKALTSTTTSTTFLTTTGHLCSWQSKSAIGNSYEEKWWRPAIKVDRRVTRWRQQAPTTWGRNSLLKNWWEELELLGGLLFYSLWKYLHRNHLVCAILRAKLFYFRCTLLPYVQPCRLVACRIVSYSIVLGESLSQWLSLCSKLFYFPSLLLALLSSVFSIALWLFYFVSVSA